jgi:hypothetical protein
VHRSGKREELAMHEYGAEAANCSISALGATAFEGPSPVVIARVPQGMESRITARLLPAREVILEPVIGCRPRRGAPRRDAQPIPLPEGLADKLKGANGQVIGWLTRDAANARAFMEDPVTALAAAGVELNRSEQKALGRAHQAVREVAVIPPGVVSAQPNIKASRSGKVGEKPRPKEPKAEGTGGAGC